MSVKWKCGCGVVTAVNVKIIVLWDVMLCKLLLEVCHPRCVCENWQKVYSQTQLCQLRCVNDYTRQLHVSAPTGHLQVVFKRT